MQIKAPLSSAPLRRGFSLLELVFVLSLAVLLIGIGLYNLAAPEIEKELRQEHAKVEDLVLQARTLAVSYQQPFVVIIQEDRVQMQPQAKPEVAGAGDEREDLPAGGLQSLASQSWPRQENFEAGYKVEVARWGEEGYRVITERNRVEWIFEPNGLCEPIEIRLTQDHTQSYLSRKYHPLTGLAEDEEMVVTTN